ncbi:MAG TPA: hypothetical protein VN493_14595 [Thermoanaerobaculia bacterium]|nr:hypothetical protein [Thermoanaerobaculia bacterium]
MSQEERHPEHTQLLVILAERVLRSGRSMEDLEAAMGLEAGALSDILAGRMDLAVDHLSLLAGTVGFEVVEVILEARVRMAVYGDQAPVVLMTFEDLQALVRTVVREEMAGRAGIGR